MIPRRSRLQAGGPGEQDYFYGMSIILVRKPIVINGVETYIWEIDLLRSVTQG